MEESELLLLTIYQAVEVHSSYESEEKGNSNGALTSKEFAWDHREFGEFPFPNNEGNY